MKIHLKQPRIRARRRPIHPLVKADTVNPSASAVVERYAYDGFGKEVAVSGVDVDKNAFRFSTKQIDAETGMNYYGYRFYAANAGRWINRDPVLERGGLNIYGMVKNNTISSIDLLGKASASFIDTDTFFDDQTVGSFSLKPSLSCDCEGDMVVGSSGAIGAQASGGANGSSGNWSMYVSVSSSYASDVGAGALGGGAAGVATGAGYGAFGGPGGFGTGIGVGGAVGGAVGTIAGAIYARYYSGSGTLEYSAKCVKELDANGTLLGYSVVVTKDSFTKSSEDSGRWK